MLHSQQFEVQTDAEAALVDVIMQSQGVMDCSFLSKVCVFTLHAQENRCVLCCRISAYLLPSGCILLS